jgi:alpha-beta hydrolase superfamily lysophospholipase
VVIFNMQHNTGWLNGYDDTELFYQSWQQFEGRPIVIAIVHGAGEHSGRYSHLIDYFVPRNYSVYGFDFRGHGKSQGKRGHVLDWRDYREDLDCYLQRVIEENPDSEIFLYGHSMGGQISLDYLTQDEDSKNHPNHNRLCGAILSSPALALSPTNSVLLAVGRFLSKVWPSFPMDNGLDVKDISRELKEVKAYSEDPLVSSKITARFGTGFIDSIDRVQNRAGRIGLPILMFHGEADNIVPVSGTRDYFSTVTFEDKTLQTYGGGFHECHNDLQKQEVFEEVERWLEQHSNLASASE